MRAPFALRQAIALVAREPARAEEMARARLAAAADDIDALTVLGAALRAQGELAAARAALADAAAREAAPWPLLYEWAQLMLALGDTRAAAAPLERATAQNPALGGAWRLLGDLRLISGDPGGAEVAYDRMLAAVLPDARLRGPATALADGRADEAVAALRPLLAREPGSLAAAHLLAEALARRGELGPAETLLAHVMATAPGLALARLSYALVLQRAGKFAAAVTALEPLEDARARIIRTALLTELGDHAGAAAAMTSLLAEFPDQPHAWVLHGHGLRTLGRAAEAVSAWRRALALDPGLAEPWWALANLKDYPLTEEDRAAIARRLSCDDLPTEDRSLLAFALAKALEDAGRDAEAFARYAEANALQRSLRRYDADATSAQVGRAKAAFTPAFLSTRAGWGAPDPAPIFVVGLPRSGSTLVEQILASHPAVEATRELMDVQWMAAWVEAQGGAAALPRPAVRQLGLDYLARTAPLCRLGRPRFVDKAPWNWLHVGLVRLMLPNAHIVEVRRHPLGTCVSAFRQHFAGGFDFAYDLTDLGRYYADYVDLMAHFDAAAPGAVHRVIYERLVADTEAEVRRLLDALGLPFDPACLRFFENPRAVATPSSEQVRRPIFTEGVDHWRRFEPWLDPLKAALGPALAAYPDAP